MGVSNYVEPSTPGFGCYATEAATIRIEPSGTVNVYIAGGSTGNSIETTVVQLTADALGVDIDDVATIQGDTAVTGFGAGAAGSRSGSMTAGAVRETATILRDRIVAIAAHKLEAALDDIELGEQPRERARHPVGRHLVRRARRARVLQPGALPPGVPAGLEASARYTSETGSIWVNATHVCTCEVDVVTGQVTLLRYIVSEDCGPMINPNVVEGQIAGGVVQGIGGVALRAPRLRRRRQPRRHHVHGLPPARPRPRCPSIEYGHIETPSPGPGGYKGVGEGRRHRRAAGGRERGGRRPRTVRRARDRPPAEPVAARRAAPREDRPVTDPVYYDPYDVEIDADPYPVFRRLREEAPLYYNEQYDFYAVSRYDDVERGLVDRETNISGRGGILELIKADIEMPPGILIFEDPPTHTIHRALLSRVFTPRQVNALEPRIREFCVESLDPLVGADRFDFVADLGAQMPMRVIGMLLGIPEQDQEAVRDQADASLRTKPGRPQKFSGNFVDGEMFGEYIDWRAEHPSDDVMTQLLQAEFEDETGTTRRLTRAEILTYVSVVAGAGNETTTRLIGWAGKVLAEHPDQRRELVDDPSLIPNAIEELLRYEPPAPHVGPLRGPRRRAPRAGRSRRAARCCSSWGRPTATTAASPTATGSTSTARSATTSPSGTARTSAWARRSPGSKDASRWKSC